MQHDQVILTSDCDRRLVAAEVTSERTVEWVVTAPQPGQRHERAPLNLALVLDRSGSMHGDKLAFVKRAAAHLHDLLDERDRIAIVAYDDQITTLAPSEPLTEQARRTLHERVGALKAGGTTDLSGGWLRGCQEVAEHQSPSAVNRALLLTDGLANRGITDSEELGQHARELRQRGVSTTTFGVGLDFNEHLLGLLAEWGGGHFHYIDQASQIPGFFKQELGELLTVVAREAFLAIGIPKGVTVDVQGDLPHERESDRIRIFLGDLSAGEQRRIYTKVFLPPDRDGTSVVLRAELGYADLDGRAQTTTTEQWFSYARQPEVLRVPLNDGLLRRASEVAMASAATRALKLERQGQSEQARAVLLQSLQASAPYIASADAQVYGSMADEMRQGMTEQKRKQVHFAAYRKRQSRDSEA